MRISAYKQKPAAQTKSSSSAKPSRLHLGQSRKVRSILRFQRAIANQAVQGLPSSSKERGPRPAFTAPSHFVYDFSKVPVFRASPMQVKSEMKISALGDTYEKEADRVADQVTRIPETTSRDSRASSISFSKNPVRKEKRDYLFPARSMEDPGGQKILNPVEDVLLSPGQPLDSATRSFFESRFGHGFNHVRVHTGTKAEKSARTLNASAYTTGPDVIFGPGQYRPDTEAGGAFWHMSSPMSCSRRPAARQPASCSARKRPRRSARLPILSRWQRHLGPCRGTGCPRHTTSSGPRIQKLTAIKCCFFWKRGRRKTAAASTRW